jgi:hypothetical protein
MKKVLSVLAVAALLMFNGCNPPASETPITDVLKSAKKGWVMTSVQSAPAYVLDAGVALTELFADGDYDHNTGFFYAYEKDDIIIFGENGVQTIDPGTLKPDAPDAYQVAVTALYRVDETNMDIYLQMPWEYNDDYTMYDDAEERCSVQEYSKDKLVLKYTRNDDEYPAKAQNTFTITYVPVK